MDKEVLVYTQWNIHIPFNLEKWDGEADGREVQNGMDRWIRIYLSLWLTHVEV